MADSTIVKCAASAALGAAVAAYFLGGEKKQKFAATTGELPGGSWKANNKLDHDDAVAIASDPILQGTMLLCAQNLAVSGANQVLLNIVEGAFWKGPVVLCSPSVGPFAKEFADLGYPTKVRQYACHRVGRETGQPIWFGVAKQQPWM